MHFIPTVFFYGEVSQRTSKEAEKQLAMEVGQTLQVLLRYVRKDSKGDIDASGILSRECFDHWLRTRNPKPRHPEEAFRKIITAHCRGDCGMHTFSPEIEASLLKVLRQRRVWPCFRGKSGVRIGLRGFQTKGYWEKVQECNDQEQVFQYQPSFVTLEDVRMVETLIQVYQFGGDRQEGQALAAVLSIITEFRSKYLAQLLVLTLYKSNPAVFQMAAFQGQYSSVISFFFSKEFVVPSLEQRRFSKNKTRGRSYANIILMTSCETDKTLNGIYGGSITNKIWSSLRVFPQKVFLHQDKLLLDFFIKGVAWQRTLEYRFDGTPVVLLNKYTQIPGLPDFALIETEDISEHYSNMLAL